MAGFMMCAVGCPEAGRATRSSTRTTAAWSARWPMRAAAPRGPPGAGASGACPATASTSRAVVCVA
jgi:hypothetical protein